MTYDFTAHADRELRKLPKPDQRRLIKKLKTYLASPQPLHHAEKIEGAPGKVYRYRVGPYRIIFDWLGESILVTNIGLLAHPDLHELLPSRARQIGMIPSGADLEASYPARLDL